MQRQTRSSRLPSALLLALALALAGCGGSGDDAPPAGSDLGAGADTGGGADVSGGPPDVSGGGPDVSGGGPDTGGGGPDVGSAPFWLGSSAFAPEGEIPAVHTCDGADTSPPLAWSNAPAGTQSFALIVQDPDAPDPADPQLTWIHWVLYDLPATTTALPEGVTALPAGTVEGTTDFGDTGWGGPCPPIGRHRYFFLLSALDTTLGDQGALTAAELRAAMDGHVLGEAVLMGTYESPAE